jgi:hypothetical protein
MKKFLILFLLSLFSCGKKEFIYKKNVQFQNCDECKDFSFPKTYYIDDNIKEFNFHFLNGISVLNSDDTLEVKYYGNKIINNSDFIFFSKNKVNQINKGFIFDKKNNLILKIFEDEVDSSLFFKSYIVKNYILLLNVVNENFDTNTNKNIKYEYCIVEIDKNSNFKILDNVNSKIILENFFIKIVEN